MDKEYYDNLMHDWANQYLNAKQHHCRRVADARMRKMSAAMAEHEGISIEQARKKLESKGFIRKVGSYIIIG